MGDIVNLVDYKKSKKESAKFEEDYKKLIVDMDKLISSSKKTCPEIEKQVYSMYLCLRHLYETVEEILGLQDDPDYIYPYDYLDDVKQTILPWMNELLSSFEDL